MVEVHRNLDQALNKIEQVIKVMNYIKEMRGAGRQRVQRKQGSKKERKEEREKGMRKIMEEEKKDGGKEGRKEWMHE